MTVGADGALFTSDSLNNRISRGAFLGFRPFATLGAVSYVGPSAATLNGMVNPNGFITTAQFDYGLSTAYGNTASVSLMPNDDTTAHFASVTITGLTLNTTYYYRLTATNVDGSMSTTGGSFTIALAPVDNWRLMWFGVAGNIGNAADTANPSGDGIANLMKYAVGTNPLVCSNSALPATSMQTISGQKYLTISFTRALAATDITCNVDVSGALSGSWNQGSSYSPATGDVPANSYTTQVSRTINGDGVTETIVVRDNMPLSPSAPHRFMRLRVARP